MMRFVVALLMCILLVMDLSATAATIDAYYCVNYNLDYQDGDTGDLLTGSTTKARGAKLQLERSGGGIEWIWLDWDGPDAGCGWFNNISVGATETFSVRLIRHASVNGNTVKVWNNDSQYGYIYSSLLASGHHPEDGIGYVYYTGPSDSINIMAAATWALHRRDGGVNGANYDFYTQECSYQAGTSCYDQDTRNIYIWSLSDQYLDHADEKFSIVHEMGHAIAHAANGFDGYGVDLGASADNCADGATYWSMTSKEYQSAAIPEGLASFYAAVAFNNDGSGDDCEYELLPDQDAPDWNADESNDPEESNIFNCETGFEFEADNQTVVIRGYGYIDQFCLGYGTSNNRGTVFDWLRHLWDLTTDYPVGVDDIFDMWDLADPDTWNLDGNGTGGDYPARRMHDAADDVGGQSMQDDYDQSASFNWAHLGCGSC